MSKITKWKLEKTKVKVVFRLQFHATHVPQSGWDKLFISFIPADSGKATAKTTKANVRNGTCKWSDPIYETTRLLQDAKTKEYDEKLYKFVVSMGSSRSSILGEAIINLADYADALKPSVAALPLHGCNSGTTLHVTVQLLTSKTGFREFEQQRETRDRGLQANYMHDEISPGKADPTTENVDKVGARIRSRSDAKELSSVEEETGNEERGDSTVAFDGSSNASGSVYAEKNDTSSVHEIDSVKSAFSGDMNVALQSPPTQKVDPSDSRNIAAHGNSDSVQGWCSDYSVDNDLAMAYQENNRLRGNLDLTESSIFDLKLELNSLQSQADEIGLQTQKFSHILATEVSSYEELSSDVAFLKSECYKYKDEIERLKSLKLSPQIASSKPGQFQHHHLLEDIQAQWMKGMSVMEDMVRELQSKIYLGFHERDTRFLHAELEALLNTLLGLKHGTGEAISLLNVVSAERTELNEIRETSLSRNEQFASGTGFELEVCEPEIMLSNFSIPPLISQETDSTGTVDAMKKHIVDLVRELDGSKAEKESLARKMGQMELYYEALIHELEESQKQVLGELQNLRNEHSTCLYTVSTNNAEMESLRQNMKEQILRFAEERHDLDILNKELERRATTSEAALRRARLNYSIAVGKLQNDLELLSSQVLSMFETNENLIKQAFSETSQSPFPRYMDLKQDYELSDTARMRHSPNQNMGLRKQQGGDVLLEDMKRSLSLQEELYQKVEEELMEMHSVNLQLDIFSRTLQETLSEAISDQKLLKIGMDELAEKLRISDGSRDTLMVSLQEAMADIHILSEYKFSSIAKINDLSMENEILNSRLESILDENSLLLNKIADWEAVGVECKKYQSQYEHCLAEKMELSVLLEQEALVSGKLGSEKSLLSQEISTLKDEMSQLKQEALAASKNYHSQYELCLAEKTDLLALLEQETLVSSQLKSERSLLSEDLSSLKYEISELNSAKEDLEKTVRFIQEKVGSLLSYYDETLAYSHSGDRQFPGSKPNDCRDGILLLEEIQHNACSKIVQLTVENSHLEKEKLNAVISLSATRSEFLAFKQMFRKNIQDMVAKMDISNAMVENLQVKLETFSNKVLYTAEAEEKYIEQQKELLADLGFLEQELQNLVSKDGQLVREMLTLDDLAGKFDSNTSTISGLIQEKKDLVISLEDKTEESAKLASEVSNLKENVRCLLADLSAMVELKDNLESRVGDLTSQLGREQDKLIEFNQQQAELAHVRQLAVDLELEKSRLSHLLFQSDEKFKAQSSYVVDFETDVLDLRKSIISADVMVVFLISTHMTRMQDCKQQLRSSEFYSSELQKKYHDLEKMLEVSLVKESCYTDEIAHLIEKDESLRSDLEACVSQNKILSSEKSVIAVQLEKYKMKLATLEVQTLEDKDQYVLEMECLKNKLQIEEEETVNLLCAKEKMEIALIVLKDKIDEQLACVTMLEECKEVLMKTRAQNAELADKLSQQILQSEEVKNRSKLVKINLPDCEVKVGAQQNEDQYVIEVEQLRNKVANVDEETSNLTLANMQLEITSMLFRDKLSEQINCTKLLGEWEDELMSLRAANDELSNKLSKQIMKNEELKNLSIHLKELKDRADAECLLSRKKRDPQEQPVAVQESLRMAFIKEQSETKIQELKQQLAMSKRHAEEMLMKLQDAVDEIENRKRSEALCLKKNEEMSLKLLALDDELQLLLSDSREKAKACDRMKAELECALLSLECCKEEKEKLQIALQQSEQENFRIAAELSLTKEQPEDVISLAITSREELVGIDKVNILPYECPRDSFPSPVCRENLMCRATEDPNLAHSVQAVEDGAVERDMCTTPEHAVFEADSLLEHIEQKNYLHHSANFKSSINHLHEELERMKRENSLFPDDVHFNANCHDLQDELLRLERANEELRNIFPLYNEISCGGNALERVMALEIELAEALRAKQKPKITFESSFIKQHSDEEAIFKSFRDINELIKELLEVRGRYAAAEGELREMHDRYSQLSLKFAEVEGDRQKIKMTLKNVRQSRKVTNINRSSSAMNADVSP